MARVLRGSLYLFLAWEARGRIAVPRPDHPRLGRRRAKRNCLRLPLPFDIRFRLLPKYLGKT